MPFAHVFFDAAIAILIVACAVSALPMHSKKSAHDLQGFASALNGAGRLRYGKRSYDPRLYPEFFPALDDTGRLTISRLGSDEDMEDPLL
ncbi:unnamed protein product [Anisakis simplex]|uniref:Secreted protein n=1 Tax=Anisakis simplex TaxID=6269 RepID=A0A0M3K7B8_ANISI|nr:unnamed protein product [Anisakis simplex]